MSEKKVKSTVKAEAPKKKAVAKPKKAIGSAERQITIDGTQYPVSGLSDRAKAQIMNLQLTDRRIAELQQELMLIQTARQAYADALKAELNAPRKTLQ